ncbi:hypothetical protein LBW89_19065 [Paenibacillus sp. alder61]|uniref:hypothetical protein n=1 Tax=Paenibacillus TaxID=44249 RepID=UPI001CD3C9E3|nr:MULTISPECIES: hypothetical protein [Paenibacillus]MCA1295117.1 hypothetical protein [Paenibacillus sp. alder61]
MLKGVGEALFEQIKARGLLAYMLSKLDSFRFYIDELVRHTTEGKDSIRAGMKELEQLGTRSKMSAARSCRGGWIFTKIPI